MPAAYKAPLEEFNFILDEVLDIEPLLKSEKFAAFDRATLQSVLEEAGKLIENSVAPIDAEADQVGCQYDAQSRQVSTPPGLKQAYQDYAAGGWIGLPLPAEVGGQDMPQVIATAVKEMLVSGSMAFSLYPCLTEGAVEALYQYTTPELKERFLPPMAAGRWTGTMCLTEPQAGSDLGLLSTKAEPQADGSYKLTGTKIFISGGEHDLTENIVHSVLARLPDAPAGSKGISLFLVPKMLVKENGDLGEQNRVYCAGIENKMGIHGSSTCVMQFEGATGYLVGEPNRGLASMFTMMNSERLFVGLQGLGTAEKSYQLTRAYAQERLQGREATEDVTKAEPIAHHPDVLRMLLTMRSYIEGCRMLSMDTARYLDLANSAPDARQREEAKQLVELLTPVCKAYLTDSASLVTDLGVQVHGGVGYMHDYGVEQCMRDARIARIYEGTNGIQALDLVTRKLPFANGATVEQYLSLIDTAIDSAPNRLNEMSNNLRHSLNLLREATEYLLSHRDDPVYGKCAAVPYLNLFGTVALGYYWLLACGHALAKEKQPFFHRKLAAGRFFYAHILPQSHVYHARVMSKNILNQSDI